MGIFSNRKWATVLKRLRTTELDQSNYEQALDKFATSAFGAVLVETCN